MCGLFGIYGRALTKADREIFMDLGIVSALRGQDSTGMLMIRAKKNKFRFDFYREATDPIGFFNTRNIASDMASANNLTALIGHTRAATIGTVSKDNAHPYHHKHIVGMHNGTIPSLTPPKGVDGTDSNELYRRIAEVGVQEALDGIRGSASYALVWLDANEGTINFLRNEERSLWFMAPKTRDFVVWASERCFLDLINARTAILWDAPTPLVPDTLETIRLSTRDVTSTPVVRKVVDLLAPFAPSSEKKPPPLALAAPAIGVTVMGPATLPRGTPLTTVTRPGMGAPVHSEGPVEVLSFRSTHRTMDPADKVAEVAKFPRHDWPRRIIVSQEETATSGPTPPPIQKYLWYIGPKGTPEIPGNIDRLLQKGCALTGQVATVYDKVLWVSEALYIMPEYKDDPILGAQVGWTDGYPVYATMGHVVWARRQAAAQSALVDEKEQEDSSVGVHCH